MGHSFSSLNLGVPRRSRLSTVSEGVRARAALARPSPRVAERVRHLEASASFVAVALLAAAVVLWGLDWVLFDTPVVLHRLPLEDGRPGDKLLLAGHYRDARVLHLGDSRVLYGVDPALVSETCGCGPGYNAAIAGADTRLTRIMADRLLQTLAPTVVVIGVSQWELSDAAVIGLQGAARELVPPWQLGEFGVTLDRQEQLDAGVSAVWRLYRYRREVRPALDPSRTIDLDERRRGFQVTDHDRPRLRDDDLTERKRQWFTQFSVRGRRAEALRGLLADLRERGVRVVLVAPPLYPKFHTRVRREIDQFRAAMRELATEGGAAFEDFTAPQRIGVSPEQFQDVVHLNEAGAAEFSRQVGKVVKSRLDAD